MNASPAPKSARIRHAAVWAAVTLAAVALVVVVGVALYANLVTAQPESAALEALSATSEADRQHNGWLVFGPATGTVQSGLVFYPGGLVDPQAYAPAARAIAEQGHLVVVVPMPLNLAVLGSNRATQVIEAFPEIERWAIGGHSLGGAMAAQYACDHPGEVQALVLWAAYPPEGCDLAGSELAVTSIYATNDGLVSAAELESSRGRLPSTASFVPIEGGNHAQFGRYGPQKGDQPATIAPEVQQAEVAAATAAELARLN